MRAQLLVPGGGEGSGVGAVKAGDNVVADQHERRARADAGGKRQIILRKKLLVGTLIDRDARVGVGIAAVAGKVLEDACDARIAHRGNDLRNIVCGRLRVLSEAALIDKILRVCRNIAHRRKVHRNPETVEPAVVLLRVGKQTLQPDCLEKRLGGGEF